MTALSDLITRLEAAKEGSRELDADLHPAPAWYDKVDGEWRAQYGDSGGTIEVPHYTTSLDAALTLVPNPFVVSVKIGPGCICHAAVGEYETRAKTAPLAICIASLKTREARR